MTLDVTRDFAHETLSKDDDVPLTGRRTVLDVLESRHEVEGDPRLNMTVDSIDGLRQDLEPRRGDPVTWVVFVNGLKADPPPEDFKLYPGDVVQADLRRWHTLTSVRATVGAFPQPFTGGMYGDRIATTVRCADSRSAPCRDVERALRRAGVATDGTTPRIRGKYGRWQLRRAEVVVGTWREIRQWRAIATLPEGLAYARVHPTFTEDGTGLTLRDWNRRPVRTLGAGTGFIAAMKASEPKVVWVVTGVDQEGVERAARAIDDDDLRGAYAVAITDRGVERLPVEPAGGT